MDSLHAELSPFGIAIVNPRFFRTELLSEQSTSYAEPLIPDYAERREKLLEFWKSQNGKQTGDPARLAQALVSIASQSTPPGCELEVSIGAGNRVRTGDPQLGNGQGSPARSIPRHTDSSQFTRLCRTSSPARTRFSR
jgi:hypothetical protein